MDSRRKPFQGVTNIIRFNWHFFIFALVLVLILHGAAPYTQSPLRQILYSIEGLTLLSTGISLLVSWFVYDLSGFYVLDWLKIAPKQKTLVNIHAGFDETSHLIEAKFSNASLVVLDFYDPKKHTEVSIRRAREAYPAHPIAQSIETGHIPLPDDYADHVLVIFSAHEIRDAQERLAFFEELRRVIKPTGQITITEHLRDLPNFLAYNFGFFHFYGKGTWKTVFEAARLHIKNEGKITPFIAIFTLEKNGTTP